MKLGKINTIVFILFFSLNNIIFADDKIISTPLINLENLKPSFEDDDKDIENKNLKNFKLKEKKNKQKKSDKLTVTLIGLDKITAKAIKINIKIGETKKFGVLDIKVLKCGTIKSKNTLSEAAYIQVKDSSEIQNEQVFIFNGWTFSSNPSIAPIDHAIYDIWLVGCENA